MNTPRESRSDGISFVPGPAAAGRMGRVGRLPALLRQALRLKGDVYHLHNPAMLPVAVGLKWLGKRVIYDTHEDFSRRLMIRRWIPRPLRRPACWGVSRTEYLVSRIVDATLVTQARQVDAFGGRATLLRNAPALAGARGETVAELARRFSEERGFYRLLYVGSLSRARGIDRMLDVLAGVRANGLDARLWLIGPDDDGVVEDLRTHPAWDAVDYLGLKGHEEAFAYMANADVGMAILPDVADHADAMPSKLFEYMAKGLPFVASNFSVWRSFIGDEAGCWVDPAKLDQAVDAVCKLLADPERRQRFAESGMDFIDHFNWESEQEVLLETYRRLTGPRG
ncbi:glycosyltransferase [Thioalkalivibrio sp. ALR17-21]|uniref:glycosyltransferase n=1 Tax=Thioalkalivibrio sp. ALR17-21 TaxID=1269813 RepID=UPI0012DCFC55|nr:glycosyltransferase [Thioalkalivibrio sp. ALR17-21]